jgi:hypothetical protein
MMRQNKNLRSLTFELGKSHFALSELTWFEITSRVSVKSTIFNHSTPACQAVEAITHDTGYLLCAFVEIQLAGRLAGGAV